MTQVLKRKHSSWSPALHGKVFAQVPLQAAVLLAAAISLLMPANNCSAQPLAAIIGDSLVYPIMSPKLSSKYGTRRHPVVRVTKHHNGVDLAAPKGAQIRSIAEGVVVFADPFKGYGKLVVIKHPSGITSHYGHCSNIHVSPGAKVRAGQIIATVGRTGLATGNHLHFEIRKEGKPLDPERFIPDLTIDGQG